MRSPPPLAIATLGVLLLAAPVQASQVEPRVRLLVRDRPSASARVVDRVPAGKKLPLIGRTPDGAWAHVQSPRHDGWVPSASLKGRVARSDDEVETADDEEARKPLAPKKGVRAEAWVSQSRYHDGEDTKMTVSANKAELYGRPAAGGAVLGIVRRGEVVHLVRRSSDKRWCMVDVGGGEVAWLEASKVRKGAFRAPGAGDEPAVDEAPAPPSVDRAPREVVERAPDPEPAPPPPPPPPAPARKSRRAQVAPPPPPAPPPEPSEEQKSAKGDEEEAPIIADKPKKKGKKAIRLASRTDVGLTVEHTEATVEKSVSTPSGANSFSIGVQSGIAILDSRFTSNGTGALANYEASTSAFGLQLAIGYGRAIGKYFRLGIDGSYTFAGAAGVRYRTADGDLILGVQSHDLDAGLSAGVHLNVIGGLDLALRLGVGIMVNMIAPSNKAPLPSDLVVGMTIGAGVSAPNLLHPGNRPLGVHLFGGGLVPANREQTGGLEDGTNSTTMGAFFGAGITYGLLTAPRKYANQLYLQAGYNYLVALTHYSGTSRRNATVTSADRGTAQHLIGLGLAWNY